MKEKKCAGLLIVVMVAASILGILINATPASVSYAKNEFTVESTTAILETQKICYMYAQPDTSSKKIAPISVGVPVNVTGVTSNGWFQVEVGGTFYMEADTLAEVGTYANKVGKPATPTVPPEGGKGVNPGGALPSGIPYANEELLSGIPIPTVGPIEPDPIYYMPVARKSSMDYNLASTSDINKMITAAAACHANKVYVTSRVAAYKSIWSALNSFLKNKQIYTYEEATVNTCSISSSGKKYTLTFGHVSTLDEEAFVDEHTVKKAYEFNYGTDYEKICRVHDWICEHVEYSRETASGKTGYDYRSAYDALASGKAVSTGYALLFQKFMDIYEIPCYVATGNNHSWNYVQIDGKWYYIDCTNDDQANGISKRYFLIGATKSGYSTYGGLKISASDYVPEN
ncbi:MAG: hypothetical protein KBS85_00685 [Lachnospiraceae bacterium]|nr:hypothetical protein [Candidatus Merdinaster equi]